MGKKTRPADRQKHRMDRPHVRLGLGEALFGLPVSRLHLAQLDQVLPLLKLYPFPSPLLK
jgi:hypothetical protein